MPNNHLYFYHCVYKLGYKVYYFGWKCFDIWLLFIYYVARTFCVIFKYICCLIIWVKIYCYMMWYKIIDGHRHFKGKIHIILLVTCVPYSGISGVSYSGISVVFFYVSCMCISWCICCYPKGIYLIQLAKCNVDSTGLLRWILHRIKWAR